MMRNESRPSIAAHLFAALASLVLLGACASLHPADVTGDTRVSDRIAAGRATLLGSSWSCTNLNGVDVTDSSPPTLEFAAGDSPETLDVSGFTGVNRFGGVATFANTSLRFGPLRATRMAGSEERMAIERSFIEALQSADSAEFVDGVLELRAGGSRVASFVRTRE